MTEEEIVKHILEQIKKEVSTPLILDRKKAMEKLGVNDVVFTSLKKAGIIKSHLIPGRSSYVYFWEELKLIHKAIRAYNEELAELYLSSKH